MWAVKSVQLLFSQNDKENKATADTMTLPTELPLVSQFEHML